MKKKRLVYDDNMARHVWEHSKDRTVAATCSDAIYRQDPRARAEVLRLYARLTTPSL